VWCADAATAKGQGADSASCRADGIRYFADARFGSGLFDEASKLNLNNPLSKLDQRKTLTAAQGETMLMELSARPVTVEIAEGHFSTGWTPIQTPCRKRGRDSILPGLTPNLCAKDKISRFARRGCCWCEGDAANLFGEDANPPNGRSRAREGKTDGICSTMAGERAILQRGLSTISYGLQAASSISGTTAPAANQVNHV